MQHEKRISKEPWIILEGGSELAVGAAKLLEQHVAELRIGFVDAQRLMRWREQSAAIC